jgi:hypothetical protein
MGLCNNSNSSNNTKNGIMFMAMTITAIRAVPNKKVIMVLAKFVIPRMIIIPFSHDNNNNNNILLLLLSLSLLHTAS